MPILTEKNIINKITNRELFSATIKGGAFTLTINKYEPALSAAIHNGDKFSEKLANNCLLSQEERYHEEDPYTGSFIQEQGITLIAHDSRYAYDLNRKPNESIYECAWGKEVWRSPLRPETRTENLEKHAQFYRVLIAIIDALHEDYGVCVVYDIHSYNYRRYERTDLPVFNLGTTTVTNRKWQPVIAGILKGLREIQIPGFETTVAENDIFLGKGFLATCCHKKYENTLVLAIEVKKIFMNELTGEADGTVLPALQQSFNAAVRENTQHFVAEFQHSKE